MDPSRQRRKEEINHALRFIESSLAYPDPEGYKDFLTKLVCNLLDEGNAFFRDGLWEPAIKEFTEALNVSSYAETSNVQIPVVLLESLYVNRAAAYHSMGDFEQGVQDCDSALKECSDSRRALYRKALCLKELGQYKDAYQCTTNCLLLSPQDKQVLELAQELSVHLGLRTRKPYVSTKVCKKDTKRFLFHFKTVFCLLALGDKNSEILFAFLGVGIYSYVHKQDLPHQCQRSILLCRRKDEYKAKWTRVRRIPTPSGFTGPFVLCREVLNSEVGLCQYGEKCTFAYNQLEIDVWTEERKGTLDRDLLFEPNPLRSIIHLLQENKGTFMYLCQICYDNKPRIISKRSRNNPVVCYNVDVRHNFDTNKCLAFVVRSHNVTYGKIRPLIPTCCLDLCSKALRYDCEKEENCPYAHSVIELKTWKVQRDTGIRPDEIIKVSEKHEKEMQNLYKSKAMRVRMFIVFCPSNCCGPCLRDGHAVEPNKGLKHCSGKAKHAHQVLLVRSVERSKWVQVRPLPHAKHHPAHYDICTQILRKGKCTYPGNCTFAHSQEEKKMWTYMKSNELWDMQQMYDMWLSLTVQNRQEEPAQHASDDRDIVMPTDHAEPLVS
uniref:Zinc finger CCCH-type containing 7B n=1 Tax=Gouania willdenowi TaxID=441366 RepID=A0A8C5ECJ3_GOUWI